MVHAHERTKEIISERQQLGYVSNLLVRKFVRTYGNYRSFHSTNRITDVPKNFIGHFQRFQDFLTA